MLGTTLGHYRIVDKIGEGGMGVVYRAHDETLDRDLAIKVLSEDLAQSRDRLDRFEREAKAWFAGRSWFTLLIFAAIAGYGFWISLAGRPLMKADVLESQ